jgi:hypothetical protein
MVNRKKPESQNWFAFATKGSATKGAALLEKATGDKWRVAQLGDRWQATRMKTVVNLMSGQPVEIPFDTPLNCDPSSETYWSS